MMENQKWTIQKEVFFSFRYILQEMDLGIKNECF